MHHDVDYEPLSLYPVDDLLLDAPVVPTFMILDSPGIHCSPSGKNLPGVGPRERDEKKYRGNNLRLFAGWPDYEENQALSHQV